METMYDLVWKMECKGFDVVEIHFYLSAIWMIASPIIIDSVGSLDVANEHRAFALAQAHVEIDFTNFKKNR